MTLDKLTLFIPDKPDVERDAVAAAQSSSYPPSLQPPTLRVPMVHSCDVQPDSLLVASSPRPQK